MKLDKLLKEQNHTIYWLAKETGINWNSISNIANDDVAAIRLDTIDKICKAMKCDIQDLMEIVYEVEE